MESSPEQNSESLWGEKMNFLDESQDIDLQLIAIECANSNFCGSDEKGPDK